jgi:hypothetical protein
MREQYLHYYDAVIAVHGIQIKQMLGKDLFSLNNRYTGDSC